MRFEWGCDDETGIPIVIGQDIVTRCPHALVREQPHAARWGRWASKAHAYMQTGNLAVLTRHGDLSDAGDTALAIASNAESDRFEEIRRKPTGTKDVKWPVPNQT